jgi:hypothetical protein
MKIKLFVIVAITFASFQAFAANNAVHFSGSVQRDNAPPVIFTINVPAGETSKLTLEHGIILRFSAAATHGNPDRSVVRLLDSSGKQLHVAI